MCKFIKGEVHKRVILVIPAIREGVLCLMQHLPLGRNTFQGCKMCIRHPGISCLGHTMYLGKVLAYDRFQWMSMGNVTPLGTLLSKILFSILTTTATGIPYK